ncbi:FtsK/SpoIIIE domain-containing protein [Oerskovia turbata]
MRITLHPDVDLDVTPGTRLGDLRPELARATCRPELASAPLLVDGAPLGDDHPVGARPLLPGATLRAAPTGADRPTGTHRLAPGDPCPDPHVDALRAPWHVAVLSGPRCGDLLPLRPDAPIALEVEGSGTLVVRVGARRRRGQPPGGAWRARVRRAAPRRARRGRPSPAVLQVAPDGRARHLRPGVARRWIPGRVLRAGATTYDLRSRPRLEDWDVASGLGAPEPPAARASLGPSSLALATAPMVGSLVLAATTRQPLFALLALIGPLTLLLPLLLARRRRAPSPGRPAAGADRDSERARPTTPARPLGAHEHGEPAHPLRAHGPADRAPVPGEQLDRSAFPVPCPADLMTGAVAAHHAALETSSAREDTDGVLAAGVAPRPVLPRAQGARLPDACVAVVGPREARLRAARALLLTQVASGAEVDAAHADEHAHDWSWLRWLPGSRRLSRAPGPALHSTAGDPRRARVLLVDLGAERDAALPDLESLWARRHVGDRLVLLAADRQAVPAWCRAVLDAARHDWRLADGTTEPAPDIGVGLDWADRYARHVAAAAHLGRWPLGAGPQAEHDLSDPAHTLLPATVSLTGLLGAPVPHEPAALARWIDSRWSASLSGPRPGLDVPLGHDARGLAVHVDLARDGPHALVAGTTGAGKSELLQSLVLALALTHSPRDLAITLVDFKGGAGFGDCVRLPHVVGQVTDLEPGLAGRALAGLRAELRRRERLLADARATDIDDLPRGALPRLVVVIDEFRALADDLPDFLPGLLRLAAQGRSLGVHLVLATQRPAGAVSADIRANISLRLALRQLDPGDSRDVIDAPHAARIPAERPGRAVLRRGSDPPLALQCAHAAASAPSPAARVRTALPWGSTAPRSTPAVDLVPLLVTAARDAARAARLTAHAPPWLPALPGRVTPSDLEGHEDPGGPCPGVLPFALSDLPDQQARGTVAWRPESGHLAVVGRPRSGRSTALRALAVAALDRGWHVHLVTDSPGLVESLSAHPRCGTVVSRHDPRRVARLVDVLLARASGPKALVLLDDVEDLRDSLARLASGAGADSLGRLLGEGPARGVHAALAATSPGLGGLAQRVGPRLVLPSGAAADAIAHGVPSRLAGHGGGPGRGVWLGEDVVECQVVVEASPDPASRFVSPARASSPRDDGEFATADGRAVADGRGLEGPLRLAPLPRLVTEDDVARATRSTARAPDADRPHHATADVGTSGVSTAGRDTPGAGRTEVALPAGAGTSSTTATAVAPGPALSTAGLERVIVGLGGDHADPVVLDVSQGALVVGGPRSGRSSALLCWARQARTVGRLRVLLSPDERFEGLARPVLGAEALPLVAVVGPRRRAELSAALRALPGAGLGPGDVVVVDDLDLIVQAHPLEAEALSDLLRAGAVVLAGASTTSAAMAHRGPVAELRSARSGLVLSPHERGSGEVFGRPLGWSTDPDGGPPGRAVAIRGGDLVPVQATWPGAGLALSDAFAS